MMRRLFLAALLATPALAQMPAGMDMGAARPVCVKAAVVPGFEGWGKGAPGSQLSLGGFSALALAPAEAVKFSPPLDRAPAPGSMGGVYAISLKAGRYRFALAPGAWIDVIGSKGDRLPSAAHMHGPDCSGIGKIVDYRLDGGDYLVQFSATRAAKLQVMVVGG